MDGLVALHADELDGHGRGHLRIARELDQAGRPGDALGWAERALDEAPDPDPALIEYLAGRYAAAGRTALRWWRCAGTGSRPSRRWTATARCARPR